MELLPEKINRCNNLHIVPTKLCTSKIKKGTACGFSLFTQCSFDNKKNKYDFMKRFCPNLKEHAHF